MALARGSGTARKLAKMKYFPRLLRARRERPRHRAADKTQNFTTPHVDPYRL